MSRRSWLRSPGAILYVPAWTANAPALRGDLVGYPECPPEVLDGPAFQDDDSPDCAILSQ